MHSSFISVILAYTVCSKSLLNEQMNEKINALDWQYRAGRGKCTVQTHLLSSLRNSTRVLKNNRILQSGHLPGQLRTWRACPSAPSLRSASTSAPISSSAACPEAAGSPLGKSIGWRTKTVRQTTRHTCLPVLETNTPGFNPRLCQLISVRCSRISLKHLHLVENIGTYLGPQRLWSDLSEKGEGA